MALSFLKILTDSFHFQR
ncbi:hypothetical protein RDI58_011498 [Solanum bulbocastanum]|uniref:Uncharacterized protein n=1 Tax=Solanum bulbocastanum TaxID=147425 RepID=A0AAN8YHD1_SOLBU